MKLIKPLIIFTSHFNVLFNGKVHIAESDNILSCWHLNVSGHRDANIWIFVVYNIMYILIDVTKLENKFGLQFVMLQEHQLKMVKEFFFR